MREQLGRALAQPLELLLELVVEVRCRRDDAQVVDVVHRNGQRACEITANLHDEFPRFMLRDRRIEAVIPPITALRTILLSNPRVERVLPELPSPRRVTH
ncbi:hypothetical protein GCM10009749_01430 [Agromyces neolithicus]|uniref:Uncharacterized protein n=1 Tax=Agromyces neolithicus TaxID=269420 RepID=A0ABP4XYM8_9MICO